MSLGVEAYVESFEELRKVREEKSSTHATAALEDVLEDRLDELWLELSVEEIREVERRYPELRIRRLA